MVNLTEFSRSKTLLWFRPNSPLNYALPSVLDGLLWDKKLHIPADTLTASTPSHDDCQILLSSDIWFLSSPTAAYCAAKLLDNPFWIALDLSHISLAVIGQATLQAWFDAGGFSPKNTVLSTNPDSMGLFEPLKKYRRVSVLRAQTGRPDLLQALKKHGAAVASIKVYEKLPNPLFKDQLNQALKQSPACALFFTSTEQVKLLLPTCEEVDRIRTCSVFAAYPRIAESLIGFGFKFIYLHDPVTNKFTQTTI